MGMEKPGYFQTALSNFVTDAACGGAVRHLTDIGYTLDQICDRLDYPAPRAKVQKIMMEHLYESRILLQKEPSMELFAERTQFIQEQDAYGRRTMRKIKVDYNSQDKMTDMSNLTSLSNKREGIEKEIKSQGAFWKESVYERGRDGKLTELLHFKCENNGEENSYVSCAFSFLNTDLNSQPIKIGGQDKKEMDVSSLNNRQREYLSGIRWEKPVMYHRLDQRMREIVSKLYEAGSYTGACYFLKTREKLIL